MRLSLQTWKRVWTHWNRFRNGYLNGALAAVMKIGSEDQSDLIFGSYETMWDCDSRIERLEEAVRFYLWVRVERWPESLTRDLHRQRWNLSRASP